MCCNWIVYIMILLAICSLAEKFKVHSQLEKADHLLVLTESFVCGHLETSFPRSDAHYGVLSFLLNTSHSPLHATFEPATPTVPPAQEEWFDWTGYLMEGIEYSSQRSSDSEVRKARLSLSIICIHRVRQWHTWHHISIVAWDLATKLCMFIPHPKRSVHRCRL